MNRWVAMAIVALLGACGDDGKDPAGEYHCPVGYLLGPMLTCVADQEAPPCDCFVASPFCCAGDACINNATCDGEVWKCASGWRISEPCDRSVPATREE